MICLVDVKDSPIAYDASRGQELRERFSGLPANLLDLITGVAGCSPYLASLLEREADWLKAQIKTNLDAVVATTLNDIQDDSFQVLSDSLRCAKRRIALITALADLGGVWPLEKVAGALTELADKAVDVSLTHLVGAEIACGKLPGCTPDDAQDAAGMVALAMGKMGAGELNYSSDIDLIMLFDETRHDPENYAQVRASFIRVTQRMVKLLSENTAEGYVFRTDLRLRPDPSVTPVCIAMEPAERYYESLGRTWERAAYIKARPCAGSIQAGWDFLERLRPFIWRKYLDFAAIEDAHDMRLRIRDHKGLHGINGVAGHDMKLGAGGIREIEFFTQTRQIICGGRDADVRQRETIKALDALSAKGWVEPDLASFLQTAYLQHRDLEHRLQMLEDAQTHKIPETEDKRMRLAAFCGAKKLATFEGDIENLLHKVHEKTESFFAKDDETTVASKGDGFSSPEFLQSILDKWNTLPSMRSDRARRIFARIQPDILRRLQEAANPDEALIQFDAFLAGLPSGVQVFSLFEANPNLLDLLADICGSAPRLAEYLGRNVRVFDAVIGGGFYDPLPPLGDLTNDLQNALTTCNDYETILDQTRRWVKEQQFRVGVHVLRSVADAKQAARGYTDIAEACLTVLFPVVCDHFSKRYGPVPGKGAAVISMGKLGSYEMTATSDLDLIVVYDAEGVEITDGPKSLAVGQYFSRLTQAFLSAISVPTAEGSLYEVDMRLRPSGRKGAVATSISAFNDYQMNEAWTWEHLALTRARVIVGDEGLCQSVQEVINKVLSSPRDMTKTLHDVQDMRDKLEQAKANKNMFDVKNGAGRLMDVSLFLQTGVLLNEGSFGQRLEDIVAALVRCEWLSVEQGKDLTSAIELYNIIQQIERVAVGDDLTQDNIGKGLEALLLKSTDADSIDGLLKLVSEKADSIDAQIEQVFTIAS